jgi:hypothetical protein
MLHLAANAFAGGDYYGGKSACDHETCQISLLQQQIIV